MLVDKSEARVRRMFGQIARRYDLLNHLLSLNIDKHWRRQTVRRVPPRGDDASRVPLSSATGVVARAESRRPLLRPSRAAAGVAGTSPRPLRP